MKAWKRFLTLLLAVTGGSLCACAPQAPSVPDPPSAGRVTVEETGEYVSIYNDKIALKFAADNGSLVSLFNRGTDTENLCGEEGGNFTLYIDAATDDMWKSKPLQFAQCQPDGNVNDPDSYRPAPSSAVRVSSRGLSVKRTEEKRLSHGASLTLFYDVSFSYGGKQRSGISVESTVTLYGGETQAEWTYKVKNDCAGSVVMQFVGNQLDNFDEKNDYSLFWPMHEGELHPSAFGLARDGELTTSVDGFASDGTRKLVEEYPSHLSVSLVQLYDEKNSLFLYAADDESEYKQFNFGIFDGENEYDCDRENWIGLSLTQYPFVEAGKTKELKKSVLGVGGGGWYEGADSYRAWRLSTDVRSKNYMPSAEKLTGFGSLTFKRINDRQPDIGYDKPLAGGSMPEVCASFEAEGIDDVFCLGWMDEGFDSKYPDYNFNEAMGGEAGFRAGIARAKSGGDRVIPYVNLFAATEDSDWFRKNLPGGGTQGAAAKVKNAYGEDYRYVWPGNGTATAFYNICPGSQYFVNAIDAAVDKLARCGAGGIFFDQLMEMSSNLCFDPAHGHTTPATAYGEGYEKLFSYIRATMDSYTDDYYFSCEGVCDAYLKYVDVPGLMWDRRFGWSDYSAPQTARYTLPSKFMGLPNFGSGSGAADRYARAFLMGCPLRVEENDNPAVKALTDAYKAYPDLYFTGRYLDRQGLTLSDGKAEAGVMLGGKRIIVSVYNPEKTVLNVTVGVDMHALSGAGAATKSVTDVFSKEAVEAEDGVLRLSLSAGEIRSFVFEAV